MSCLHTMSTNVSIIAKNSRGQWGRYYFAYERQMLLTPTTFHVSSPLVSRNLLRPFVQSFTSLSLAVRIHCNPTPLYTAGYFTTRTFPEVAVVGSAIKDRRRPTAATAVDAIATATWGFRMHRVHFSVSKFANE